MLLNFPNESGQERVTVKLSNMDRDSAAPVLRIDSDIHRSLPSERPPYFHARMARKRGVGADKR